MYKKGNKFGWMTADQFFEGEKLEEGSSSMQRDRASGSSNFSSNQSRSSFQDTNQKRFETKHQQCLETGRTTVRKRIEPPAPSSNYKISGNDPFRSYDRPHDSSEANLRSRPIKERIGVPGSFTAFKPKDPPAPKPQANQFGWMTAEEMMAMAQESETSASPGLGSKTNENAEGQDSKTSQDHTTETSAPKADRNKSVQDAKVKGNSGNPDMFSSIRSFYDQESPSSRKPMAVVPRPERPPRTGAPAPDSSRRERFDRGFNRNERRSYERSFETRPEEEESNFSRRQENNSGWTSADQMMQSTTDNNAKSDLYQRRDQRPFNRPEFSPRGPGPHFRPRHPGPPLRAPPPPNIRGGPRGRQAMYRPHWEAGGSHQRLPSSFNPLQSERVSYEDQFTPANKVIGFGSNEPVRPVYSRDREKEESFEQFPPSSYETEFPSNRNEKFQHDVRHHQPSRDNQFHNEEDFERQAYFENRQDRERPKSYSRDRDSNWKSGTAPKPSNRSSWANKYVSLTEFDKPDQDAMYENQSRREVDTSRQETEKSQHSRADKNRFGNATFEKFVKPSHEFKEDNEKPTEHVVLSSNDVRSSKEKEFLFAVMGNPFLQDSTTSSEQPDPEVSKTPLRLPAPFRSAESSSHKEKPPVEKISVTPKLPTPVRIDKPAEPSSPANQQSPSLARDLREKLSKFKKKQQPVDTGNLHSKEEVIEPSSNPLTDRGVLSPLPTSFGEVSKVELKSSRRQESFQEQNLDALIKRLKKKVAIPTFDEPVIDDIHQLEVGLPLSTLIGEDIRQFIEKHGHLREVKDILKKDVSTKFSDPSQKSLDVLEVVIHNLREKILTSGRSEPVVSKASYLATAMSISSLLQAEITQFVRMHGDSPRVDDLVRKDCARKIRLQKTGLFELEPISESGDEIELKPIGFNEPNLRSAFEDRPSWSANVGTELRKKFQRGDSDLDMSFLNKQQVILVDDIPSGDLEPVGIDQFDAIHPRMRQTSQTDLISMQFQSQENLNEKSSTSTAPSDFYERTRTLDSDRRRKGPFNFLERWKSDHQLAQSSSDVFKVPQPPSHVGSAPMEDPFSQPGPNQQRAEKRKNSEPIDQAAGGDHSRKMSRFFGRLK